MPFSPQRIAEELLGGDGRVFAWLRAGWLLVAWSCVLALAALVGVCCGMLAQPYACGSIVLSRVLRKNRMSRYAWPVGCWWSCVTAGCIWRVVYVVTYAAGCIRRVPDGDRGSAARCVCIGIRESPLVGWLGLCPMVFRQLCMYRHAYRSRCWWIWERTWGICRLGMRGHACSAGCRWSCFTAGLYLASCVCRGVHNSPDAGGLGFCGDVPQVVCVVGYVPRDSYDLTWAGRPSATVQWCQCEEWRRRCVRIGSHGGGLGGWIWLVCLRWGPLCEDSLAQ